ncbi:MAG: lipoprotein-releasing ABC transporter permease subunit [Rhodospirillaceae bacterium]
MIFGAFERMVAARYLRARRKEGFVSVIAGFSLVGIALGVATLIIVMAVMNGFRADILDRILGVNGHINIYPGAAESMITDYDAKAQQVAGIAGVTNVTPIIEGQVLATSPRNSGGVLVRGMRWEDMDKLSRVSDHIVDGSLSEFNGGEGILIGVRMSERYGVQAGDEMTLISPNGNVTAFGTAPRSSTFVISGVFNTDMTEYDSSIVFMPLALAQAYFKVPSGVTSFEVRVADPDTARGISGQIETVLGPKVRVLSWEQTNAAYFNALAVERNVMFLILTMIILVAVLNVISGLIMLVKDKGSDIAILRTMGASRGMIMRIFFIAGASVGVIGTLTGLGLGVVFCDNIESIHKMLRFITGTEVFSPEVYFLSQIPAKLEWRETALIVLMALALSFGATLYPSWRAARIDPVEALRYE